MPLSGAIRDCICPFPPERETDLPWKHGNREGCFILTNYQFRQPESSKEGSACLQAAMDTCVPLFLPLSHCQPFKLRCGSCF